MADTNVVTTGLNMWSITQPSTILPRGPLRGEHVAADEAVRFAAEAAPGRTDLLEPFLERRNPR